MPTLEEKQAAMRIKNENPPQSPVIQSKPQREPEAPLLEEYYIDYRSPESGLHKKERLMALTRSDAREKANIPEGYRICAVTSIKRIAEGQARYNRRLKEQVVDAYGGRCSCPGGCPITDIEFLTLDHSQNDGKADRESIGMTTRLFRWLIKNGFPKDRYRLLCYNCNFARAKNWRHGFRCPHEMKRQTQRLRALSQSEEHTT